MTEIEFDPFAGPSIDKTIPTTEAQRELFTALRFSSEATLSYNESVTLSLRGKLDVARLTAAVANVVHRHDLLRATISGDGLSMLVAKSLEPSQFLRELSYADLDPQMAEISFSALLEHEVTTPFDLTRGPLIRFVLANCAAEDYRLVFTAHHIVCDGWSTAVIIREIKEHYNRESTPPVESFEQFAELQRKRVSTESHQADLRYWLNQVGSQTSSVDLPSDRPRPPLKTFRSARCDVTFEPSLVSAVKKAGAKAKGASLFATTLAAFTALVHRITHADDVIVGVPTAGQSAVQADRLVGHAVNTLPLRFHPTRNAPFTELLSAVSKTLLDGFDHQQLSFGELLKALTITRDPSRLPLVSVLFNLDRGLADDSLGLTGLRASLQTNPRAYENFDLFLNCTLQADESLHLECQYNVDLFDRATIERWLNAYRKILSQVALDAGIEVGRLSLSSDQDLALFAKWNATAASYPLERSIDDWIAQQANKQPDAVAVVASDGEWTYRELDTRATQLARHLKALGAASGQRVGIYHSRKRDLLVAMLAVLKSGAAYVPLDPSFPSQRLTFMCEDAKLAAIITEATLQGSVPAPALPQIVLDRDDSWMKQDGAPLSAQEQCGTPTSKRVAYVIYTSGSTGLPKGVLVQHSAVTNFIHSMHAMPGIRSTDTLVAVTTLSFDIAVLELLAPLCAGARVVLASKEQASDGSLLSGLLHTHRATLFQATPATYRLLFAAGWRGARDLRVLVGGEALPKDLAQQLAATCKQAFNMYGPTETTVWSSVWPITLDAAAVSLGHPIANTSLHVLDELGNDVPIGVTGELWIGGAGVTLGYLDRPELTQERFVNGRYRTGDVVRFANDGSLHFVGRNDQQVKLRGYRIELSEIEVAMSRQPGVKQAVCMVREDVWGDARLVGYVVNDRDLTEADEEAVKASLRATLPEYMIPQHIVSLRALPLTPNAKVDRKALPVPSQSVRAVEKVAPRTPTEKTLQRLFCEALRVPDIGIDEDFFRTGGHSLLGAQLMAKVADQLGKSLPLGMLFLHPTVRGLAKHLDGESANAQVAITVPKRKAQDRVPLSLMQQRLWFVEKLEPLHGVYNLPASYRIKGKVTTQQLEAALQKVVDRHEALRTTLREVDNDSEQVIASALKVSIPVTNWREHTPDRIERELTPTLLGWSAHPFDLSTGPLFIARTIELSDDERVLFFMPHHAVFDGWSFDVFLRDFSAFLGEILNGQQASLPNLPIGYGDFSVWHRQWLAGPELERQRQYWKQKLSGTLPSLDFPSDRLRPSRTSHAGATEWITFSAEEVRALTTLARDHGATLYMVMLSAFTTTLHYFTGQDDILVGTPVRGRHHPSLEDVVGFFVNTLVLRSDLSGSPAFADYVQRTKKTVLEAFDHQDMPFELLVQALNIERDLNRTPIYQAFFSYQDASRRNTDFGGLSFDQVHVLPPNAATDISLWMMERSDTLVGGLNYNSELFDQKTMQRFAQHLRLALQTFLANPRASLSDGCVLPSADALQLDLLGTRAGTIVEHQTLTAFVEQSAASRLNHVAVKAVDGELTYGELLTRSRQLARHLRSLRVNQGDRVGLYLQRRADLLVALLAVNSIGAAYVPLDPSFPEERLSYMCEDADLALLICHQELYEQRPQSSSKDVPCLILDASVRPWSEQSTETLEPVQHDRAKAAAYVIYTSGSTGKPKGVAVGTEAVLNFLGSIHQSPGIKPDDVLCAVTTLSFDIAVLELWGTLSAGATVVLCDRDTASDGSKLSQLMKRERVSLMQATPATWRLLFAAQWPGDKKLTALVGGEALQRDLANQLSSVVDRLFNMYGPTETTVWSTMWKVEPGSKQVCIGSPLANTTLDVVDKNHRKVPFGAIGELLIGGSGVALGYFRRDELTAEKFITIDGKRRYKTGDLVRFRGDGALEYVGRNDFQVKVRGYRIELGEIEAVLAQHPSIRQAVCVVREDQANDVRLVAYVVVHDGGSSDQEASWREQVKSLPEYMRPQHYVVMDRFTLTPNGKVDRKALPKPSAPSTPRVVVPPQTHLQKIIHSLWAEALHGAGFGIDDNFFALGGHSLLAAQVVGRLAERHQVKLELRQVFETPTIREQAAKLEHSDHQPGELTKIPARETQTESAPLSLMQQRLWFVEQLAPNPTVHNLPFALRILGAVDGDRLERAINHIVARHDALRTSIGWKDKQGTAFIQSTAKLKLERIDLGDGSEADLRQELQQRSNQPFDLSQAPIAKVALFSRANREQVLFFMTHHIVSDGWSYDVFVNELSALYAADAGPTEAGLKPLAITYADFAVWHRQWLQGEELERQRKHWLEKLKDGPSALELPTDRPRPAQMSYNGGNHVFRWSHSFALALKERAQQSGATLYMALLAGLSATLFRYTEQRDLIIGTPVRGRSWPETENLLGFFANTLVLRIATDPNQNFAELTKQVKDVVLDAFDHGDMPFEQLVEALKVPRDMSRTPLYQVMFSFQDARQRSQKLGDIPIQSISLLPNAAATDITIWLVCTDDGIVGDLNFNSDVFGEGFAQRFERTMFALLESSLSQPSASLAELNVLAPSEQKSLQTWNDTARAIDSAATVPSVLRARLGSNANRTALVASDATLTYAELFLEATRLSNHLRELGVTPGTAVGIFHERTSQLLVSVLAVLQTGASYVPLDPSYPKDRVAFMIEDSALPYIITHEKIVSELPPHQARLILTDAHRTDIQRHPAEQPSVAFDPATTSAYVIYTSGSTGKPKGVLVPHRTVVNFLASTERAPGMTSTDRVMALATLSFDIAVVELLLPLYVGATIVLGDKDLSSDGERLKQRLISDEITFLQATPATWRLLFAANWHGPKMKVISTGEAMPKDVAEQMLQRAGEVWNGYGPTETTVWSTVWRAQKPLERVLIGTPLDNTQIHILDPRRQRTPVGAYGEVYIGGDGVTRGYLNRPELTRERFLTDPFSASGSGSMYRTGDIARYLEDGTIDYQGRNDHQVKVRGYRIELGEIEATLASHGAIAQATVVVREDRPGDVRIVAYLVAAPDTNFTDTELRRHLKKTLPDYMIPQHYMRLQALPLTPNGKVDRKALPAPFAAARATEDKLVAPRTETEQWLARVWMDSLRVSQVSLRDNFFDLGGHSLLSLEVIAAIEQRSGVRLNPRLLLLNTLEQVAAAIPNGTAATAPASSPAESAPEAKSPTKDSGGLLGRLKKLIS